MARDKIGQKGRRALEDANHHQLFAVQVTGNLCAHFGDALGDLLAGEKDFKALIGCGSHAHSIARIAFSSSGTREQRRTKESHESSRYAQALILCRGCGFFRRAR
jgi:hypothetical protein